MSVGVISGLRRELDCLGAAGGLLTYSGVGPEKAAEGARQLAAEGARALVSFGVAGGLASDLAAGTLVLIGDGMHNLVDGVLITAAFLTDLHLGIVTSLAVAAHEIPQEVGDFAVLLHSGYSRGKALLLNVLSSLTTLIGALVAYWSLAEVQHLLPYILAIAASSFIYIAVADLIPGLHKRLHFSATLQQITLIIGGVLVIYLAHSTLH